jgi:hypothetical protein
MCVCAYVLAVTNTHSSRRHIVLRAMETPSSFRIAFCGATGAGKSSVINALTGHQWTASSSREACTQTPIHITACDTGTLPCVTITFKSKETLALELQPEIDQLWATLPPDAEADRAQELSQLCDLFGAHHVGGGESAVDYLRKHVARDEPAFAIVDKAIACAGDRIQMQYASLTTDSTEPKHVIPIEPQDRHHKVYTKWLKANKQCKPWRLVHDVCIQDQDIMARFGAGTVLIDTPGNGDVDSHRARSGNRVRSHRIVMVMSSTRAESIASTIDTLRDVVSSRPLESVEVVCTRADEVDVTEYAERCVEPCADAKLAAHAQLARRVLAAGSLRFSVGAKRDRLDKSAMADLERLETLAQADRCTEITTALHRQLGLAPEEMLHVSMFSTGDTQEEFVKGFIERAAAARDAWALGDAPPPRLMYGTLSQADRNEIASAMKARRAVLEHVAQTITAAYQERMDNTPIRAIIQAWGSPLKYNTIMATLKRGGSYASTSKSWRGDLVSALVKHLNTNDLMDERKRFVDALPTAWTSMKGQLRTVFSDMSQYDNVVRKIRNDVVHTYAVDEQRRFVETRVQRTLREHGSKYAASKQELLCVNKEVVKVIAHTYSDLMGEITKRYDVAIQRFFEMVCAAVFDDRTSMTM